MNRFHGTRCHICHNGEKNQFQTEGQELMQTGELVEVLSGARDATFARIARVTEHLADGLLVLPPLPLYHLCFTRLGLDWLDLGPMVLSRSSGTFSQVCIEGVPMMLCHSLHQMSLCPLRLVPKTLLLKDIKLYHWCEELWQPRLFSDLKGLRPHANSHSKVACGVP
jgi:hypothetical protein